TGSEIITNSTDRWFSAPVDEVLDSAKRMSTQYYREHQEAVAERARRLSAVLPPAAVVGGDVAVLQPLLYAGLSRMARGNGDCYRAVTGTTGPPEAVYIVGVDSGALLRDATTAATDRLASQAIAQGQPVSNPDDLDSGGVLVRTASPIRRENSIIGALVVSEL